MMFLARPVDRVLSRVEGERRRGSGWEARCPAHDDRVASLSISEGDDGRALVFCHVGCDLDSILNAVGLTKADLFPKDTKRNGHNSTHNLKPSNDTGKGVNGSAPRRVVARHDYHYKTAPDSSLAIHRRTDFTDGSKTFAWFTPEGLKLGTPGLNGIRQRDLPLYRLLDLVTTPQDTPVLFTEGEKAADACHKYGLVAVSLPGGAAQGDFGDCLRALQGRVVYLWPDEDEPGVVLMKRVGAALQGIAREVRWLRPASESVKPKDDAHDFFAKGSTVEKLQLMMDIAPHCGELLQMYPTDNSKDAKNTNIASPNGVAHLDVSGTLSIGRVLLSEVKPAKVKHLWRGWIPLAKAGELLGDGGLGKGTVLCDLAARMTRHRPMPGEDLCDLEGPRGVVWYTAEDALDDVLVPRLLAAGADLNLIVARQFVLDGVGQRLPDLSRDLAYLEDDIQSVKAGMLILDPAIAFFPSTTDSHKDQAVRAIMTPLGLIAERTGATILAVRHLNKSVSAGAVYRGSGSIGFTAGARFSLLAAKDPADETGERRVLAVNKSNTYKEATALSYRLVNVPEYEVGKVEWLGIADYTANSLLSTPGESLTGDELSRVGEAMQFLQKTLADGPRRVDEIKKEAAVLSISDRTLVRAKNKLGIASDRVGGVADKGHWTWAMPGLGEPDP